MRRTALPALAAALALTLAACGTASSGDVATGSATAVPSSSSSPASSDADRGSEESAGSEAAPGAYISLADYEKDPGARAGTKVVYFFHASWCPSCRATEAAIGETGIPDGLTVVKVDFDDAGELRQRYGVTQQHTFVQVDDGGAELAKWTGSQDGAAILGSTV